jgi:MoaA/NifB/PqqE/SkfB family radical SAM enzyme
MTGRDVFERAPLRVYWETTRACDLACRHCRARAAVEPDPDQLTTAEGFRLLGDLTRFGPPLPHVILTGGDPLKRADLFALIACARDLGLGVSVAPSATPLLTTEAIGRLREAGVEAISLSLDGSTAARHDGLRGVEGCHRRTLDAAAAARAVALPFQINTLVSADTLDDVPAILPVAVAMGAARWSLFFLVAVGRGRILRSITPEACERLLTWAAGLGRPGGLVVTTTEAPHFRRVLLQRERRQGGGRAALHGAGIRDGNGILFVSHTGEITPSGFLPLSVGNVRSLDIVSAYRGSPLFRTLRAAERYTGRCGACAFRGPCGGSRARAFAACGDPLGEDPLCRWQADPPRPAGPAPPGPGERPSRPTR